MMASVAHAARIYQHSFSSRPNATLAVAGGSLNALGDVAAQIVQHIVNREHDPPPRFDITRTARFFAFGFMLSPCIGRWNVFLEHNFPLRALGSAGRVSLKALSKRVLADQMVMAPLGLVAFIGSMGLMERRSVADIKQKYSDLYMTALLANWKIWPVAQLVNFRFMPLPYRVPFQSACGVFWTVYLSIINSREDDKQDRALEMRKTLG